MSSESSVNESINVQRDICKRGESEHEFVQSSNNMK